MSCNNTNIMTIGQAADDEDFVEFGEQLKKCGWIQDVIIVRTPFTEYTIMKHVGKLTKEEIVNELINDDISKDSIIDALEECGLELTKKEIKKFLSSDPDE